MRRSVMSTFIFAAVAVMTPKAVSAQTATYRLHKEVSATNSTFDQLKPTSADATAITIASADMKNTAATEFLVKRFDTQTGVPNSGGTIPAGSTVSFSIYMSKSSNTIGVMFPRFKLFVNNESSTQLCSATGTSALNTTITKYDLMCTTPVSQGISMSATDRFLLWVGVSIGTPPGNHSVTASVSIEGTTTPVYDSKVTAPLAQVATITSLTPNRGPKNTAVHVVGTNFDVAQGASTVTFFNNLAASASNWSTTAFDTTVPAAAATGPVKVTVGGATSAGVTFTVTPAPNITSLNPSAAAAGQNVTIIGSNFLAAQASGSSTVTFNGKTATPSSWSDTSITAPVPADATSGPVVVTVSGNPSTNNPTFTLVTTGTISGVVTRATGGAAVAGATVQAVLAGVVKGSTTTIADGSYTISGLDPGTYDVRVLATGFSSEVRGGTVVSVNITTTVNVGLLQPGSISGTVTQSDGVTPLVGAAVTLYLGPASKGTTNTNGTGAYTIGGLHPGGYTVQAASVGNRTKEQGATISENANTTANLSLDPAPPGQVTYVYDELGRLASVIDPSGDAANYSYDKVGNLLSIARAGSATVSISEFTPNSGPTGTTVTVYGTGFSSTPGSNTVTFGGVPATVIASTANTLTVTAPGAGQIAVSTPAGSANTGTVQFVLNTVTGPPTITTFSPQIWDGISALTITGTNFDTVPSNDRVNLNVAFATPATASSTSLSVPIPATATSGHVTVATPTGTVISSADFFIPPPGYAASNVQSTLRTTVGSTQTVAIPTAGKFAMLLFDGIPGHRVSANFTNVTMATGTGTIVDPYGQARSSGLDGSSPRFIDAITMPTASTYTLLVASTGASTGNATVTLYDVTDWTGTIVASDPSQPVSVPIGTPGQNATLTFAGVAGHRVSLDMASTIGGLGVCTVVTLVKPNGDPLVSNACVTNQGAFLEPQLLPADGTYTIRIDPSGSATGTMTLTLYDVPADVTGTIVLGGESQTIAIQKPGQNASLTFNGANLQRISLNMTNVTIGGLGTCTVVTIKKPDTNTLVSNNCITTQGGFIDVQPLTADGTYTIVIDPQGSATGGMTLTLYAVTDLTGSMAINGGSVPVTLSVPGQNANITVAGTSGQPIRIPVTTPGFSVCATVTLLRQDNVTSVASTFSCGSTITLPSTTLPATETYHVVVDPSGAVTGNYTVSAVSP